MNGINVKAIFVGLCGLALGLYIMVEILLARTSSLGQLYLYLAIAAFVFGAVSPRPAMYVLILCTGYIDVLKRLMVVGGNPTMLDVAYILAIPPLLVAGTIVSACLSMTLGNVAFTKDRAISLIISVLVVIGTVAGTILGESDSVGLGQLSAIVNQGFYAFLFFTVPVLFPSNEDKRKLLHFSFVALLPSVFYMFWQRHFGYSDFEYRYLMSGLTIEVKDLWETMGQVRCFSTFNGAGPASTIFSIYILYCFVPLRPHNAKPTSFQRLGKWVLAPLFAVAAYFTIIRTGWVCGVGTLAAYFFLATKFRARLGILLGVGLFATIILSAPWMLKHQFLSKVESVIQDVALAATDDPTVKRAVVLGTALDRVQGWANLTQEPKIWQPFGFAAADMSVTNSSNADFHWGHDALVDALIKFGYVPLSIGFLVMAFMTYKLLNYMFSLSRNDLSFKLTRLCLALATGILVGGMGHGAQFRNFPQNLFFALWLAIPFSTYQEAMRERKLARKAALAPLPESPASAGPPDHDAGAPTAARPMRHRGRFKPAV